MKLRFLLICGGLMVAGLPDSLATKLPLRHYTTREGLGHDRVNDILSDSRGFLWFCTAYGLTQFDGHSMATFGADEELCRSVVEGPKGDIWAASAGRGVFRIDPLTRERDATLTRYPIGDNLSTNRVQSLLFDRAGRFWAGTRDGLFVREVADDGGSFRRVDLPPAAVGPKVPFAWDLLEDRRGSLWIGTTERLIHRTIDGRVSIQPILPDGGPSWVTALLEDPDGRVWVGHAQGLTVLLPPSPSSGPEQDRGAGGVRFQSAGVEPPEAPVILPSAPGEARYFTEADGVPTSHIVALLRTADGAIWMASDDGRLTEFSGRRFHMYTAEDGLAPSLASLAEDKEGNLWIGTGGSGAARFGRIGFKVYGPSDGLPFFTHTSFVGAPGGQPSLLVDGRMWVFDGPRLQPVPLNLGGRKVSSVLEDREGGWWVATDEGLFRFATPPRPGGLAPVGAILAYTEADGLPARSVSALCEDGRGDVWITGGPSEDLAVWSRATGRFKRIRDENGRTLSGALSSCASDRSGARWLGLGGRLIRLRDDHVTDVNGLAGLPTAGRIEIHLDARGRLWAASERAGIVRIEEPEADLPRAVRYGKAEGLSSLHARALAEDLWGRLYIGSDLGVDRLDPETGRIRRFTTAEGLGNNEIDEIFRDGRGALWFATRNGLSVLVPRQDSLPAPPPPVRVVAVNAAGVPVAIPIVGAASVPGVELIAPRSDLVIEYAGLSFGLGGDLRYQYRLGGSDPEWSAPTSLRAVNYARLPPGRYLFEVRAVNAEGAVSFQPAAVSLVVLPPIWRRWWSLSLMGILLAGTGVGVARYRRARAVELERVRRGIARDLHDDVGSSLSRIAILSEVAGRETGRDADEAVRLNSRIAGAARELVDNLSDIVWAIDPHRDRVGDVVQRIRRFGSDLFEASGVEFRFDAPDPERTIRIDGDIRREIFLVAKEAITNVARHSGCSRVDLDLRAGSDSLHLVIRDDGIGFDPDAGSDGNGLASMRERAEKVGGALHVTTRPGAGTTLRFDFPLKLRPRTVHAPEGGARDYPDG